MYTIKQVRVGLGFTQAKMAEALGMHTHTYAKLEKSPELMTIKQAKQIEQLSGISIEDILFVK